MQLEGLRLELDDVFQRMTRKKKRRKRMQV
jgi:hypothetical protein